ncbi:calcium-binding protein [Nocardioides bigeumensis]|uniref:Calcium-binding protein n=1 Tax=Nocardioides bigeumensis TaxID=433657 RepID=A0ABN2YZM3_9ACTN
MHATWGAVTLVVASVLAGSVAPTAAGAAGATCAGLAPTVVGTSGDDELDGTTGPDVISALGGNDVIDGLGGDDVICGGPGSDRLVGGDGNDHLLAGPVGRVPVFENEPEREGDTLVPGPGDDVVDLGPSAWPTDDYYPYDSLDLSGATTGVRVDLTAGTVSGEGEDRIVTPLPDPADGYALEVVGSAYADTMVGSPRPDLLVAGAGDDVLSGLGGDDFLLETWDEGSDRSADHFDGGLGDDSLQAADGLDTVLGGPGRDTIDDRGGVALMDGGPGRDFLWGYLTAQTSAITGGPGRDDFAFNVAYVGGDRRPVGGALDLASGTLVVRLRDAPSWAASVTDVESVGLPGYGRWRFDGSAGNDVLRVGSARVVAHGKGGDDRLTGSRRDDVLVGGPGRDRVDGREGTDRCRGEREDHCER